MEEASFDRGITLLVFGHVGLTVGLVYGLLALLGTQRARDKVDYRIVMVGALLNDIIDKPLGVALNISGRSIAHTLIFASTLTLLLGLPLVAPTLYPRRVAARLGNPAIYLVVGVWTHLLFDRMWERPYTLFWPTKGWAFPPGDFNFVVILGSAASDPYIVWGEVVGFTILLLLFLRHGLYRWAALKEFLRTGRLHDAAQPPTATTTPS